MDLYGATPDDFAAVKAKNSRHGVANPNARYRREVSIDDVRTSPIVADPLRLLDICATSDGAAALVVTSLDYARAHGHETPVRIAGISTVTPSYPNPVIELPNFATDSAAGTDAPASLETDASVAVAFKDSIADRAYAEAGVGPDDLDLAEVYDLSTALELDWYEHIGLCPPGEAERLLRDGDTTIGGRIPVNASGGLASFGEAVPAQAIAQVCELTWQLRGGCGDRQVEGARVGLSVNQGLFGHGSAVVVTR
jgi:acetyl-CoA acetyltransferase